MPHCVNLERAHAHTHTRTRYARRSIVRSSSAVRARGSRGCSNFVNRVRVLLPANPDRTRWCLVQAALPTDSAIYDYRRSRATLRITCDDVYRGDAQRPPKPHLMFSVCVCVQSPVAYVCMRQLYFWTVYICRPYKVANGWILWLTLKSSYRWCEIRSALSGKWGLLRIQCQCFGWVV